MPATIFNSPQHRKKFEQQYGAELTAILLDFDARLKRLEHPAQAPTANDAHWECPFSTFVPPLKDFHQLGSADVGPWCKKQPGRPSCTFGESYSECYEYMMNMMIEEAEGKK